MAACAYYTFILTITQPRYQPTWIILLVVSIIGCTRSRLHLLIQNQVAVIVPSLIIITLRVYLSRENTRRDNLDAAKQISSGVIETINSDGTKDAHVVDNNQLDLTDRENLRL